MNINSFLFLFLIGGPAISWADADTIAEMQRPADLCTHKPSNLDLVTSIQKFAQPGNKNSVCSPSSSAESALCVTGNCNRTKGHEAFECFFFSGLSFFVAYKSLCKKISELNVHIVKKCVDLSSTMPSHVPFCDSPTAPWCPNFFYSTLFGSTCEALSSGTQSAAIELFANKVNWGKARHLFGVSPEINENYKVFIEHAKWSVGEKAIMFGLLAGGIVLGALGISALMKANVSALGSEKDCSENKSGKVDGVCPQTDDALDINKN